FAKAHGRAIVHRRRLLIAAASDSDTLHESSFPIARSKVRQCTAFCSSAAKNLEFASQRIMRMHAMSQKVFLISPEAPPHQFAGAGDVRKINSGGIRLGTLDNTK